MDPISALIVAAFFGVDFCANLLVTVASRPAPKESSPPQADEPERQPG